MNQSNHSDLHDALDRLLRQVVILGTLAVLLIPAARGSSALIGWLPLWLMGMPVAAWWSLRRFPLPRVALQMPRRRRAQALRRSRARPVARLSRAA
ncbi:MAG: hypothetical protein ACOH1L_03965 [Thermomonas sp.]